jgi:polar amino acid transport system substrate-binding protein
VRTTALALLVCWLPRILASVLAGLSAGGPAAAQTPAASGEPMPIQIIGAARPPYVIERDGQGSGPAVEILRQIAPAAGIDPAVRILPFQRAIMALDQGGTIYPALLRTPQRETRYIWIGEVFSDRAVFMTRRGSPVVNGLEVARRLGQINVMRGSELHGMLQSFGLTDIESSNSEADIARLLRAGRIDGWFTPRAVGRATWKMLAFDPADLQDGETFALLPFWIAASANLPAETVTRLRAAYRSLRNDGRYRRIIAPLESPS